MSELMKKDVMFKWQDEQAKAFKQLKNVISKAPVLRAPNINLPFVVTTDASGFAVGATLSQDVGNGLQPIAFMSRDVSS